MFDEFKNAFQRHNNGHVQLIIINIVVFLLMELLAAIAYFAKDPAIFTAVHNQVAMPALFSEFITRPWTIVTYAFAHDLSGIGHIFFNMLTFYWFAKLIIEYLGNDKLIALYILGALAGGIFYLLLFNTTGFFNIEGVSIRMVGASAAVYAVMVAAATLLPDYSFYLMFIGPVKIKYIAGVLLIVSFIALRQDNPGGNIAHLGGALIGFIYVKQLQAGVNWGTWITSVLEFFKGLFKPRSVVKITYRKAESRKAQATSFSKATQTEIDAILDKISDRGYESLTKDEKEKLFNASKKP